MTAPARRPRLFWTAVILALLLLLGGLSLAYFGYTSTAGPDGAVRGYYAALERSDAAEALAFGDVPPGPHTLLTSTVLARQQHLAPIRDFTVTHTEQHGRDATVSVRYKLAFASDSESVTDDVSVHKKGNSWRLVKVAVPTQLVVLEALDRTTILGGGIPAGTTLLFPGAIPVGYDTPYLEPDPAQDSVDFAATATTQIITEMSDVGKKAVFKALSADLTACLSTGAAADTNCPLPSDRYVPGQLHGSVVGSLNQVVDVEVTHEDVGMIDVSGTVSVKGSYKRLAFNNQAQSGSGTFDLQIHATSYATRPLKLVWSQS